MVRSESVTGFDGQLLSPRKPAPSVGGLRNYLGDPVTLEHYRGKAVLVTFLYTHCLDVCPLMTAELPVMLEAVPDLSTQLRIVAISVDPQMTPDRRSPSS